MPPPITDNAYLLGDDEDYGGLTDDDGCDGDDEEDGDRDDDEEDSDREDDEEDADQEDGEEDGDHEDDGGDAGGHHGDEERSGQQEENHGSDVDNDEYFANEDPRIKIRGRRIFDPGFFTLACLEAVDDLWEHPCFVTREFSWHQVLQKIVIGEGLSLIHI